MNKTYFIKSSVFYLVLYLLLSNLAIAQNKTNAYESYINSLYRFMYTNQDSTQYYKQKIIDLAIQQNNDEYLISAYLISNRSTLMFNNVDELKHNLNKLDSLMPLAEKKAQSFEDFDEIKNSYHHDKAALHYKQNDYIEAKKNLNKVFENTKNKPDSLLSVSHRDLIDVCYKFMAKIHSNSAEYEQALQYLDKSIRYISLKNADSKNYLLNATYRQKSEIYKKLKDFKEANLYATKAVNFTLNSGQINSNQLLNEGYNISENYLALKQYDSSAYYLGLIKPYADSNIPYGFLYYKSKANLDDALGNNSEAETNYTKTLELLNQKWQGLKQVEIAETYLALANFHLKNNKLDNALKDNNAGIKQVQGKDVVNSSVNQITLFNLLQQKATIESFKKQFDTVLKTTKQATALLDTLKPLFKSKTDKLLLLENTYTLFETGLEAAYNKYNSNKENGVADAFFLLEKSKSTLLLEALLGAKAKIFGTIPEAVLTKEHVYKTTITNLEKRLNSRKNDALEDELFTIKSNYRAFQDTLETSYKSYYNLKYNTKVASLKSIQQQLDDNTALISFFYGNTAIYTLTITNTTNHFNKIELTEVLEQRLISYQKQISTPNSNINELQTNAKKLYNMLLNPGLANSNIENLIILPDGLLNYIPFESLVKEDNYLVKDYAISYINSATLLKELEDKKDNKNNLLAFAPEFDGDIYSSVRSESLQPLPHSKTEIQNINQFYKGNLYTNKQASLDNFKTNASNFGIIHLATHAIFNDTNPEYSYLAFGNQETDLLYVADLYNLNLNANMVTLSACESGIGDLKRGEGLLSLARGFYFSGAQSISSTLWKINDASSSNLMSNFYQNLSKGQTKHLALQNAKLSFLKENKDNALSHPYYWSGFIMSGNTEPLTTTNYWLWIGLGLAFLVLALLAFRRKKLIANR